MAKTASERQKDYRNRRSMAGDNGERRINTWVTTAVALALKRLAARYGVTHREMMEKLSVRRLTRSAERSTTMTQLRGIRISKPIRYAVTNQPTYPETPSFN